LPDHADMVLPEFAHADYSDARLHLQKAQAGMPISLFFRFIAHNGDAGVIGPLHHFITIEH
jgi:hypothetical protein